MLLLSLFSSSQSVSIALYKKTKLLKFQEFNFEKNQNEKIFDCIKKIFINKKLNDLSEIIFQSGPGSFTGIRSIKSIAQGISIVTKSKIYTVNTFDIFLNQINFENRKVIVFFCSGKQTFFYRFFKSSKKEIKPISKILFGQLDNLKNFVLSKKDHEELTLVTDNKSNLKLLDKVRGVPSVIYKLNAVSLARAYNCGYKNENLDIFYHHAYYEKS